MTPWNAEFRDMNTIISQRGALCHNSITIKYLISFLVCPQGILLDNRDGDRVRLTDGGGKTSNYMSL